MAQFCCNPFDIPGHTWSSRRKNLRPVTAWMCERPPHITIGMKICDTCRKKLSKESPDATESVTSELDPTTLPSSQATESDPLFSHGSEAVPSLNVCLAEIGETGEYFCCYVISCFLYLSRLLLASCIPLSLVN